LAKRRVVPLYQAHGRSHIPRGQHTRLMLSGLEKCQSFQQENIPGDTTAVTGIGNPFPLKNKIKPEVVPQSQAQMN